MLRDGGQLIAQRNPAHGQHLHGPGIDATRRHGILGSAGSADDPDHFAVGLRGHGFEQRAHARKSGRVSRRRGLQRAGKSERRAGPFLAKTGAFKVRSQPRRGASGPLRAVLLLRRRRRQQVAPRRGAAAADLRADALRRGPEILPGMRAHQVDRILLARLAVQQPLLTLPRVAVHGLKLVHARRVKARRFPPEQPRRKDRQHRGRSQHRPLPARHGTTSAARRFIQQRRRRGWAGGEHAGQKPRGK